MRDAELLYIILAAIYLIECAKWLPPDVVVFRLLAGRWRVGYPGGMLGNAHGGFIVAPPWPPAGRLLMSEPWTVSVSPEGCYGYVSTSTNPLGRPLQSGQYWPWDEVRTIEHSGKDVLVNGARLSKAASSEAAKSLATHLGQWRKLSAAQRGGEIRSALAQTLDRRAARDRFEEMEARVRWLQHFATLLFFSLFGGGALLVWSAYWRAWPWLLSVLLASIVLVLWQFWRAHRIVYPERRGERLKLFALLLVSPPAAARAPDLIAMRRLAAFHPLAVAEIVLERHAFEDFARQMLLDCRCPRLPEPAGQSPEAQHTELWFRELQSELLAVLAVDAGLELPKLLASPEPESADCKSYCPRCRNQYVVDQGGCATCGGIELLPLR
jgi:hypothetical protein